MRGVLQQIVNQKRIEVAERSLVIPETALKAADLMRRTPFSMIEAIKNGSGVIAEFKRASPSKGVIRENADPEQIALAYADAGASGISVLTDEKYFKGSEEDLRKVRSVLDKPVLRKDFIIDPYQVYEAKSIGADCILLIASILTSDQISSLHSLAEDLGLEVLVEIHEEVELDKLSGREKLVGINNRNLDTFQVDIENSIRLAGKLPNVVRIAESGLGKKSNLKELVSAGFDGFLVGESFMKENDPGAACKKFINQLEQQ